MATTGQPPRPYKNMVWIPGGTFRMGADDRYPEEAPAHDVTVDGFWIDRSPVTNLDFLRFVKATGYVTVAERPPDAADYPGAKPELLVPGSVVFQQPRHRVDLRDHLQWWGWLAGASWRHPEGPGSTLNGRERHPVVHVAYADVDAYCAWAGKDLPTEAEWERAARGGLEDATYAWGDEFTPRGKHLANTWQGAFPWQNLATDGYERTSPVGAFPPNAYGLYDMIGNVWEWTSDWYQEHAKAVAAAETAAEVHSCCAATATTHPSPAGCQEASSARIDPAGCQEALSARVNPHGGQAEASYDPRTPEVRIPRKVMKGGSHLCAPNYCQRYRPAARMAQAIDTSTSHLGFRCVDRT